MYQKLITQLIQYGSLQSGISSTAVTTQPLKWIAPSGSSPWWVHEIKMKRNTSKTVYVLISE